MPIRFFSEEIEFKVSNSRSVKEWITSAATREKRSISQINYIFCNDACLLRLNVDFLNHKTLTDIITFDYSEGKSVSGEIYISVDRVAENAGKFNVDFKDELRRVMIHGVLHLCGYKDKKPSEKILMRKKEDSYLSLWRKMFHVKQKKGNS